MIYQYNPSQLYDIEYRSVKEINIVSGNIKTPDGIFDVTFYTDDKDKSWGTELYTGSNYVVGSTKRSWSRNYKSWRGLPDKWKLVAQRLKELHRRRF